MLLRLKFAKINKQGVLIRSGDGWENFSKINKQEGRLSVIKEYMLAIMYRSRLFHVTYGGIFKRV